METEVVAPVVRRETVAAGGAQEPRAIASGAATQDALGAMKRACVNRACEAKSRDSLCVIHCDLWHEDVKFYQGELATNDFEDTVLGYREHDIVKGLLDLAEDVSNQVYETYLLSRITKLSQWAALARFHRNA